MNYKMKKWWKNMITLTQWDKEQVKAMLPDSQLTE